MSEKELSRGGIVRFPQQQQKARWRQVYAMNFSAVAHLIAALHDGQPHRKRGFAGIVSDVMGRHMLYTK